MSFSPVWADLSPVADPKVDDGARRLGLPTDAEQLTAMAAGRHRAELAAALVRVSLHHDLADEVHRRLNKE